MIRIPEDLNWYEQSADCLARGLILDIRLIVAKRWLADRRHLEEQKLQQWRDQ